MGLAALTPLDQPSRPWLLAVAAPSELAAIRAGLGLKEQHQLAYWRPFELNSRLSAVLTGVGKANAAGAVARTFDSERHAGVISLGVAGSLPGSGLELLDSVFASASLFADEGAANPDGFVNIAALGFAPSAGIPNQSAPMTIAPAPALASLLAPVCARSGTIATVSTCAGNDALAADIARRSGALAEAMEGAAAGLALARMTDGAGLFAEVRVISNTTGDRPRQVWRLREALERLGALAALL